MSVMRLSFIIITTILISQKSYSVSKRLSSKDLIKKIKAKQNIEHFYRETVAKLEIGINNKSEKLIEDAVVKLENLTKIKNKDIASKACFILAIHYYKGVLDDYSSTFRYLLKAVAAAETDSEIQNLAGEKHKELKTYLDRIDSLVESNNYDNRMKAAALYSSDFLRNYDKAIMLYDLLEGRFPVMEAELLYAKAYLYLRDDPKIQNVAEAEKLLTQIHEKHMSFRLYPDAMYLLAKIKTSNIESKKVASAPKEANMAIGLLDQAEKSYFEKIGTKNRGVEPAFLAQIKSERAKLVALAKKK